MLALDDWPRCMYDITIPTSANEFPAQTALVWKLISVSVCDRRHGHVDPAIRCDRTAAAAAPLSDPPDVLRFRTLHGDGPAPGSSRIGLTIGPIPATTHVRIGWPAGHGGTGVALLDLDGRELRRWLLPPGVAELAVDLPGVPAGVFILSVVSGGRQSSVPFVHVE